MVRKKSETSDEKPEISNQKPSRTLTDSEILTERKLPRRSFLTAAGTLLAGGALAIASGTRAAAQEPDSDAKPEAKPETSGKKKAGTKSAKAKKGKKGTSEKDTDADKAKGKKEEKDSDQ